MENNNANLAELSKILSTARMKKGYSQRKVARLINTHHSRNKFRTSFNDCRIC